MSIKKYKVMEEIIYLFRNVFEKNDAVKVISDKLKFFPKSCCVISNSILGHYLNHTFNESFFLRKCMRHENRPIWHSWIQNEDVLIDITADQFPEMSSSPVIFCQSSDWHNQFSDRVIIKEINLKQEELNILKILVKEVKVI